MIRTFPVDELLFGIETFAAKAVKPAVAVEVNVAGLINLGEKRLHVADVILVGGADKVIVSKATGIPGSLKGCTDLIGKTFGVNTRLRRRLRDLIPMLIGTGEIKCF